MATAQQTANLATAVRVAARQVNAINPDGTVNTANLPYDQRERYVTILAGLIVQYPANFAPDEVARAQAELSDKPNAPLETYSIAAAADDFFSEAGNQALEIGASAAGVGEGVKSTLAAAKWAIPVIVVIAVIIGLLALARRTGAAKSA